MSRRMLPRRGVRNTRTPFEGSDAMRRTDELQRLTTRELCIKYENGTYPETDSMPTMGGPVGQMRFSAATLTEGGSITLPGTLDVDGGSTLRGVAVFTGAVDIAGQLTTTGLSRLEGPVEIVNGPTVLAGNDIMLNSPPPQSIGSNDVLSYNAITGQIELQAAGGGGDITASTFGVSGISTFSGATLFRGATYVQGQLTATGLSHLEGPVEIVHGPTTIGGSMTGITTAGVTQDLTFGQDYRLLARNVATCAIWYKKGSDYLCLPLLPSTDYGRETVFGDIVPPSGFTGVTASHLVLGPYSQITLTFGTVSYTQDNSTSAPQRFIFPILVNGAALTSNINSGSKDTYRLICSSSMA